MFPVSYDQSWHDAAIFYILQFDCLFSLSGQRSCGDLYCLSILICHLGQISPITMGIYLAQRFCFWEPNVDDHKGKTGVGCTELLLQKKSHNLKDTRTQYRIYWNFDPKKWG